MYNKFLQILLVLSIFSLVQSFSTESCLKEIQNHVAQHCSDLDNLENCTKYFQNSLKFQCLPFLNHLQLKEQKLQGGNNLVINGDEYTATFEFSDKNQQIQHVIDQINQDSNNVRTLKITFNNANLRTLDLTRLQSLPNLQHFSLELQSRYYFLGYGNYFKAERILGLEVLQHSSKLENISISVNIIHFHLIDLAFFQNVPSLTNLYIYTSNDDNTVPQNLFDFTKNTNLEKLEVRTNSVNNNFNVKLQKCSKINDLSIDFNTRSKFQNLDFIQGLDKLPNLEKLYFRTANLPNLSDISALSELKNSPKLNNAYFQLINDQILDFSPLKEGLFPLQNLQSLNIKIFGNPINDLQNGNPNIKDQFDQRFDPDNNNKGYLFLAGEYTG